MRAVGPALARCELTHLERVPIDIGRARAQHRNYAALLETLGCEVVALEPQPDLPDAVFVEDAAVVLDEIAVVTRPGAPSRRGETASVAAALALHRELVRITAPATLDGGDVLHIGTTLYVGATARTNAAGIAQLGAATASFGYRVQPVPVACCLHLKSAVTQIDDDALLCNPEWIDPALFPGLEVIAVDPDEPRGANALRVGAALVCPASSPRTAERLERRGAAVHRVDMSETEKAEGGVTCCSILVGTDADVPH